MLILRANLIRRCDRCRLIFPISNYSYITPICRIMHSIVLHPKLGVPKSSVSTVFSMSHIFMCQFTTKLSGSIFNFLKECTRVSNILNPCKDNKIVFLKSRKKRVNKKYLNILKRKEYAYV